MDAGAFEEPAFTEPFVFEFAARWIQMILQIVI